jgi:hypothetical protein
MAVRIKRRLVAAVIVLLALLVAAVALPACGSSSGSSDSTTAGSGDTKTYTDATYGYSFDYPTSWKTQADTTVDVTAGGTSAGSVGVFDTNGAKVSSTYIDLMLVSVYKLNVTVDDSNFAQIKTEIENVLTNMEGQDASMKVEQALAETTAAGMKGYDITYNFTKDGTPCTSTLYFLFDSDMEYQLTTQAAHENWEADQPIFDAMIASFKPGAAE